MVLQLSLPEMNIDAETMMMAEVLPQEGEDEYQLIVRVLKKSNGVVAGPKERRAAGIKAYNAAFPHETPGINKDELV